jgi:hypothetical protein
MRCRDQTSGLTYTGTKESDGGGAGGNTGGSSGDGTGSSKDYYGSRKRITRGELERMDTEPPISIKDEKVDFNEDDFNDRYKFDDDEVFILDASGDQEGQNQSSSEEDNGNITDSLLDSDSEQNPPPVPLPVIAAKQLASRTWASNIGRWRQPKKGRRSCDS